MADIPVDPDLHGSNNLQAKTKSLEVLEKELRDLDLLSTISDLESKSGTLQGRVSALETSNSEQRAKLVVNNGMFKGRLGSPNLRMFNLQELLALLRTQRQLNRGS